MRVLVTGGAGFIGSHLVEHFQGKAEVRVLENFRTGFRRNLDGFDCELLEGCVTDPEAVEKAMKGVDYVFHLAALVSVPESMERINECLAINGHGLLNVLSAARRAGVRKLCFASSAAIYGDNPAVPKVETMLPEPKSPYAITKLDGEYYCDMYRRQGWLQTASVRFFNVFGPRQDPKSAYAAAVPIFIRKALDGDPITIFGDGEQTRDFIYVKDIIEALVFLATESGATGVFNAGYGGSITINELAADVLKLTGSPSAILHAPERPGDVKHSRASAERLLAAGWKPKHTMRDAVAATVTYYRDLG